MYCYDLGFGSSTCFSKQDLKILSVGQTFWRQVGNDCDADLVAVSNSRPGGDLWIGLAGISLMQAFDVVATRLK